MDLIGERVRLRAPVNDDLDALEAIFATPEVAAWWHSMDRQKIIAEVIHDHDPDTTVYVVELEGVVAGVIQSYEQNEPDYRSAGIDISIGPVWHGTGVALDAMRTLARHLLDIEGHHRLTIDPAAANARAIAAYTKLGFRPVGVMRGYERAADGTWHDGLLMDLLAGELT